MGGVRGGGEASANARVHPLPPQTHRADGVVRIIVARRHAVGEGGNGARAAQGAPINGVVGNRGHGAPAGQAAIVRERQAQWVCIRHEVALVAQGDRAVRGGHARVARAQGRVGGERDSHTRGHGRSGAEGVRVQVKHARGAIGVRAQHFAVDASRGVVEEAAQVHGHD